MRSFRAAEQMVCRGDVGASTGLFGQNFGRLANEVYGIFGFSFFGASGARSLPALRCAPIFNLKRWF
jgi:hypothetical protein